MRAVRIHWERWYLVAMFAATTALLFADQNLLAPNLTEAARDLGLDDRQRDQLLGGAVSIVFFLVGAPSAIIIGYLMAHYDRRWLLWACVVLGETPCIATLAVRTFPQLLATRLLTGVAIGGAAPIIYALLADLFPSSSRSFVSTFIVISTGAGISIGQALAGIAGLGWRAPFAIIGVPSVLVATLMVCTTRDPKRGAAEDALQDAYAAGGFEYREELTWAKFVRLCKMPTNIFVILQGFPGCLPWGMIIAFLNDYLATDMGMTKAAATVVVLTFGAGGAVGSIVGGVGGQLLYNWRRSALPLVCGISVWLGMLPLFWLLNTDLKAVPVVALAAGALTGGAVTGVAGVNVRPMLMNVNEPETRGMALAFQATLDDVGKGLGPAIVAAMIASAGRRTAFNLAVCGWVPCGALLCAAGLSIARDEAAMQHRLASQVAEHIELTTCENRGHLVPTMSPRRSVHSSVLGGYTNEDVPLMLEAQ